MSLREQIGRWLIGGKPEPKADMTYDEIKQMCTEQGVCAEMKLANGSVITITPRENRRDEIKYIHEANAW